MFDCLTSCLVPLPLTITISYLYPAAFEREDFLFIASIAAGDNFKLDEGTSSELHSLGKRCDGEGHFMNLSVFILQPL
jgi:hypothetical protein